MSIFQRIVLLLKVLVMLSLGTSAAWAANPSHPQGFTGVAGHASVLMIAADDSKQKDDEENDDSTTEEPDTDDGDEGDSQS